MRAFLKNSNSINFISKIFSKKAFLTFLLATSFYTDVFTQCDINNPYDKIISTFHSSIALKSNGSYAVWGQLMANNGTSDVLSP